ncbi:MAG: LysM peptidoglycan-binding domain-containing protein [Chthoniobacterales bacterium]
MSFDFLWTRGLVGAAVVFGVSGCDDVQLPSRTNNEAKAREAEQTGDFPRAVWMYEAILDGTPETAGLHYKLALIYDDKLADPISALHHYRRYLKMTESDKLRAEVQEYIDRIQLVLATRAADGGLMTKRESVRLKNENLKMTEAVRVLKKEVSSLERELEDERKKPKAKVATKSKGERDEKGFSTNPKTAEAERRIGAETKTYTVQKGDTLASIARKFYDSAQRWKDIADANHNSLNGSVNLKVGQVLVIP